MLFRSNDDAKRKFFVRVSETDLAKVESVFGAVSVIDADVENEIGFITNIMSEKE